MYLKKYIILIMYLFYILVFILKNGQNFLIVIIID